MFKLVAVAALLSAAGAMAYDCKLCDGDMCCNIPSNHKYYLTDFCGGAGTMACGKSCGYATYYTADRQRFGCGATLHICGRGKCVSASVQDAGPANWVEQDAGMPIIDSSVPTCKYFSGSTSCGWSDRILITAVVGEAPPTGDGPMRVTHEEYMAKVGNETYWREVAEGWFDPAKPLPFEAAAEGCCAPDQYTAFDFTWDEKQHWKGGVNVSFDYTNSRVALFIHGDKGNGREKRIGEIADFKAKTVTTIDFDNRQCHQTALKTSMKKDCVPSNANKEREYKAAGLMAVDVYKFALPDGGVAFEQRAQQNCVEIQGVAIDRKFGVMVNDHMDFQVGIKDPAVFTPPAFCRTSDHNPQIVTPLGRYIAENGVNMPLLRQALPKLLAKI